MDEFALIQKIKQKYYRHPSLIKGVGDDTAVFRERQQDIVTAVDTFVEGIHFSKTTVSPKQIGYRALAANLSDIAAMGAIPIFYLVSIAIPPTTSEDRASEIFAGMRQLADQFKIDLIGGDTVASKQLMISITIIGYVQEEKVRYRSDAREKDIVFTTGTLGDSRAGLYILQSEDTFKNKEHFIKRHQLPTPRVRFAQSLKSISRIALNDISDGIVSEAAEIASASNINITLHEESIPVSPDFDQFPSDLQNEWKLYGGEDFELLGTVGPHEWDALQEIASETNTIVTKVGYVQDYASKQGSIGQVYLCEDGKKRIVNERGYTHLT